MPLISQRPVILRDKLEALPRGRGEVIAATCFREDGPLVRLRAELECTLQARCAEVDASSVASDIKSRPGANDVCALDVAWSDSTCFGSCHVARWVQIAAFRLLSVVCPRSNLSFVFHQDICLQAWSRPFAPS